MPATYESIATTTLGSAASSITFSSIPGTYTDLRLVITGTVTSSANAWLRYNSDTGANYSETYLEGNGTSATSGRNSPATKLTLTSIFFSTTQPSFTTVDIFSYAGSTNKTCLMEHNQDFNGSGSVGRKVGLWLSTAAINTVTISTSTSTFAAGTTATLFGILKA